MSRPQNSSFRDFKPNAESSSIHVEPNKLLLVTLSSVVMLAKKQPMPREFHQCTKFYLEGIKAANKDKELPNVGIVLKMLEEQQN